MSDSNDKDTSTPNWWRGGFLTLGNIRDVILVSLLVVITWKLVNSEIKISLESFSFTDLLSVLLAFFAIALSAAFFFKATETSNRFYDNSYKFTKEMSEILGRIESGFGEKLKHIDEGYTGLREKSDKMPFDVKQAKEEEKKEEKHIKEQEKERNQIILDLMEKAKVADGEKEALLKRLEKSSQELDKSKNELRRLQRNITRVEGNIDDVSEGFIRYLADRIEGMMPPKYLDAPARVLNSRFKRMRSENLFDEHDLHYMEDRNLTDDGELTAKGARVFKRAIERSI